MTHLKELEVDYWLVFMPDMSKK